MKTKSALAALLLVWSLGAQAQFTGHNIQVRYLFPNQSTQYEGPKIALVDSSVEFPSLSYGNVSADVDATSITLGFLLDSYWFEATFSGPEFFDVDGTIPDIVGVTVNASSTMPGLDASRVTFDANHIWVNWQGLTFDPSMKVILDIKFAGTPAAKTPNPVPAVGIPALIFGTLSVFGAAGFISRRRMKT